MAISKDRKSIKEFFQQSQTRTREDKDLLLALELSKKEQIKEQEKILISLRQSKKRLVQTEVEEDWFQTVSNRPQTNTLKKKKEIDKKVKKESKVEDIILDIDDVSDWLKIKEERNEEESLVIEDFSEFLNEETILTEDIRKVKKRKIFNCSICEKVFDKKKILEEHIESCQMNKSDSDCSIIDLVNSSHKENNEINDNHVINDKEEEDGYLSPLEGFTNINENPNEFNEYHDQFKSRTRLKSTEKSIKTKKNSTYRKPFKKRYFRKRKK